VLSLLVRAGAIASLAQPELVVPALFAAHVGSRAILPAFMWFVSPARSEGLSAGAGRPTDMAVIIAAVLGILALFVALGPGRGFGALVAVLVVALALGWLTRRQIGGQTGDVLGGLEQVSEMAILLVAARI
jgi:adenosylcobinamide-GDP ribazoletransferase